MRDWRIEVTTEGGFTGRGLGAVTLSAQAVRASDWNRSCEVEISDQERRELEHQIAAALECDWRVYVLEDNPYGYADQIRYTITLDESGQSRSASWLDETAGAVPHEIALLFRTAWHLRDRTMGERLP